MKYIAFVLIIFVLFYGCDDLVDSVVDCIDDDGPKFETKEIPAAGFDEPYFAEIEAAIHHEENDSAFDYNFSLEGDLPAGISWRTPESDRIVEIYGTPNEYGEFAFTLTVYVSEPEDDNFASTDSDPDEDDGHLCYHRKSHDFILMVE